MSVTITINEKLLGEIDAQLKRMAQPTTQPLHAGLRKAANVVRTRTQSLLPKPGYPGDKPDVRPLRESINVKTKEYQTGTAAYVLGMVGYNSRHGWVAEHGHRIGTRSTGRLTRLARNAKVSHRRHHGARAGFVPGRFDLETAARQTKAEQDMAVIASIRESVEKTLGPNPTGGG